MMGLEVLTNTKESEFLYQQIQEIQSTNQRLHMRDIAAKLGVTEAQLLSCKIPHENVRRLTGNWADFLAQLANLGRIMALTRNEACVMEHKGHIESLEIVHGNIGLVIGSIELRLFLNAWHIGFAVESQSRGQLLKSFQIFDAYGVAVIKFFLQPESNHDAYEEILKEFLAQDQAPEQSIKTHQRNPKHTFNQEALLEDWRNMKDTHDFHMILRKHNADRLDAIDSVGGIFSAKIADKSSILKVLETVASTQLPIMIFVSNGGSVQIHQNFIQNVKVLDQWYNVLDENFNLHLNTDKITAIRLVRKPTEDGIVTSIEIFDEQNDLSVQIFGLRKPGNPENLEWRQLAESLI